VRPSLMNQPPGIDPREYAVESRSWGEEFGWHLVSYDGRYFAWTVQPSDVGDDLVYELPSERAAREVLMSEQARHLLTGTGWGSRVVAVEAVGDDGQPLFSAAVADGAEDGIWLATSEADPGHAEDGSYALDEFDDLSSAVEAFAARAERAATWIERLDIRWPGIVAAHLRYRAAFAQAGAARALLGDLIRSARERIRAERAVSRVAATVGVSREFLYHILAGDDWAWKGLTPSRPNVAPPQPRTPGFEPAEREARWTASVRFAIEAPDEREARAIAGGLLGQMGVPLAGEPVTVLSGDGVWTASADLDLSGLPTIEPDNAQTRLTYLAGRLPEGVTWSSRVSENQGSYDWPPSFWDRRPGRDDELAHPAIRAAMIHVSAGASQ
jgi:DNA-binding phage protein